MRPWLACAALVMSSCTETTTLASSAAPSRSFHLGFAWQPFDWNEAAFEETGRLIADNGDLIGVFFDAALPWQEALDHSPLPPAHEQDIERRLGAIRDHQKVLLGLNLLASDRTSLAANLGETETPRSGKWKDKTFDDPEVLEAYLNYCRLMIRRFEPDYFVYIMEADAGLTDASDPSFRRLLSAIRQIYPALKAEYPELPIMLEFMLENEEETAKRAKVVELLLPYSDYYAVSTYPFQMTGGDPAEMPRDWFRRVREIAPNKPFAVVETNWLAESFYHPTEGIPIPFRKDKLLIPASEEWQAAYIDFLLSEAQALDAEFVIQWNIRDLDRLDALLSGGGSAYDGALHPFMRLANDCGLIDQDGVERPALAVWRRWLEAPRR